MTYVKQTWVTCETITAEKLNHIEDGVAEINGNPTPAESEGEEE